MSGPSCVLDIHLKADLSSGTGGKYGRMFPTLAPLQCDERDLLALGKAGSAIDLTADDPAHDNPRIAAGHTMFGHMLAHDITADRSLLAMHASLRRIHNFRTPALNFESLYGLGPSGAPYMYDADDPDKFLIGADETGAPTDLPRNRQGRALMGDPRNDVHGIIAQLHLAMLKLHNRVVDKVRADGSALDQVFAQAQRNVRWHLQWIVLNEFLPLTAGEEIMADIAAHGRRYFNPAGKAFIPVEFADAAYRFGHAQIRVRYDLNGRTQAGVYPDLAGGRAIPASHVVDWRRFLALNPAVAPQASKRIEAHVAHTLIDLPESVVGQTPLPEYHSLACRDLTRARALNLPSGEDIARHIGAKPLSPDEAGLREFGWNAPTPLWYYILKEASVRQRGERLGEVGARIVAEVLHGIIQDDPTSYVAADPAWRPVLPSAAPGSFTLADAVRFAIA
ncbi:MAG: peroxidase [Candidatus Eremiobacteraeota bacterium]|nr:peroxidase [Candidatus Eremiobacteraeota bacterium]MBV8280491.1 peroxidase [Candidatus Eremiobacteraeota bacterium]